MKHLYGMKQKNTVVAYNRMHNVAAAPRQFKTLRTIGLNTVMLKQATCSNLATKQYLKCKYHEIFSKLLYIFL